MNIYNLGSSSAGNCYVISTGKSYLMVECGYPLKTILHRLLDQLPAPGLPISRIDAVLVTHSHGDHSRGAIGLSAMNKIVMASQKTLSQIGLRYGYPLAEWVKSEQVGDYRITPFTVDHDCEGAIGYIIDAVSTGESLLFVHDAQYVKWNLKAYPFDYVMIECNYTGERLIENDDPITARKAHAHMSLATTIETLKKMDLSRCRGIYLMHMSDGNADEETMLLEVKKAFGIPTYSCLKDGGIK